MYGNKGQVRDVIMDWTIFQRNISIFMHLFLARYLWNTISNDNSVYVFVFLPDIHIYERFGLQNLFQPIVRVWQVTALYSGSERRGSTQLSIWWMLSTAPLDLWQYGFWSFKSGDTKLRIFSRRMNVFKANFHIF